MRCSACGAENPPSSRFCDRCGRPLPVAAAVRPVMSHAHAAVANTSSGTNGMAIASMVLGILWLYGLGSVLALVFGYVALNQIARDGGGGRGMAIAGVALGWVGLGVILLITVVVLGIFASY